METWHDDDDFSIEIRMRNRIRFGFFLFAGRNSIYYVSRILFISLFFFRVVSERSELPPLSYLCQGEDGCIMFSRKNQLSIFNGTQISVLVGMALINTRHSVVELYVSLHLNDLNINGGQSFRNNVVTYQRHQEDCKIGDIYAVDGK